MPVVALALAALALFLLVRARFSPVKACRRCAGVGCRRCDHTGHRMRRGVSVAHRKR
jgi:primosomal protein N'